MRQKRRWRTFIYTFPTRERCNTSGVNASRSRCRPDWFCCLENPYKTPSEARETYRLVSLKQALWNKWRKLDHSITNKTLGSWYKQCILIYNPTGSQIENILQWKSFYEKFIDKIKVFQNWWITSCISLCKTCDPQAGAFFSPRGITWTTLIEVHWVILHTKYQGSRPRRYRN